MPEPDTLRHWRVLFNTNPKFTKDFTAPGGMRGTSIAPAFLYLQLTEIFGPNGVGWGTSEPDFKFFQTETETIVYLSLECWYIDPQTKARAVLYGVGGDRVIKKDSRGVWTDDDSMKKCFTDAIGNAFQRLGAGGDIHLGLFSDTKYLVENRERFKNPDRSLPMNPPNGKTIEGDAAPEST